MVKHRTERLDKMFKEQLYAINKALQGYHHVQAFDVHTNKDPNDEFNEVYSDGTVRIIYNYVCDYIEILTDDLCLKGEILHLFIEPDPDVDGCYRTI